MKFLVFSDVHGNENEKLYSYLENNDDIDLVIISGDITNFGPLEFVNTFITKILTYNVDVIAIPGNCDIDGVPDAITDAGALCLHNKITEYGDALIFGYGGSNETPFDTPGEFKDEKIYEDLHALLEGYDGDKDPKVKILLTHAPPLDTKADLIDGGVHVGSEAISKVIKEFQPNLNLCGHIHEACSEDCLGKTAVFNPGMLENDGAVLINIENASNFSAQLINL